MTESLSFDGLRKRLSRLLFLPQNVHLSDEALLTLHLEKDLHSDEPLISHLSKCHDCSARFNELQLFLERLTDEVSTASEDDISAIDMQRAHRRILRRIERAFNQNLTPRILRFPSPLSTSIQNPMSRRWWLIPASISVIVGLAVGSYFLQIAETNDNLLLSESVDNSGPNSSPMYHAGDERFMQELESALTGPDIPPLVALDELTPRLREVAVNVR